MMNQRLKFIDRYLTLWIFMSMVTGLLIGHFIPAFPDWIGRMSFGTTSVPLAIGLILMMYPPLVKVDYSLMPSVFSDRKVMLVSLFLNWVVGPVLMFLLAFIFLHDQPQYMSGLILVGLARCIAMVIVWNELASGNREYGAMLIALNSIFQVLTYSAYAVFFINVLPSKMGMQATELHIQMMDIFKSVLLYLGVPFAAGATTRILVIKMKGHEWFSRKFVPAISPVTLYALLFTIVVMFSMKGEQILQLPYQVAEVALPLIIYFFSMFFISFFTCRWMGVDYPRNAAVSFTASGNNFELAIAVSIAVFGIHSPQAFVGVIGPLVEVPALILLVKVSSQLRKKFYPS